MLLNFIKVVSFLLVLLICFTICQPSFAEKGGAAGQNSLILFKEGTDIKNGPEAGNNFKSFTSPSFGYFGNLLVVFAQAEDTGKKTCDIVEGFAEFKSEKEISGKFLENSGDSSWTRRVVKTNDGNPCKGSPITVVNGKYIFVFFNSSKDEGGDIKYQVIANNEKIDADVSNGITWEASPTDLTAEIKKNTKESESIPPVASGGSGLAINNSLILPVWYTKSEDKENFFSVIINASKDEQPEWKLVSIGSPKEGKYPAVVEWESNKLIMMISCSKGIREVYEYSYTQTTWTEAVGPLSGVWGNTKEREAGEYGSQWGFITANIQIGEQGNERKKVMFLAQPIAQPAEQSVKTAVSNYKLHLWMTDYRRVFDAGEIATGVGQNISSTLLFAENSLFAAYEKWDAGKSTIHVMHLKEKLEEVKNVLRKWIKQDDDLKKSCMTSEWELKSDNTCTDNKIPVHGLVGFLSNNYSDDMWKDEYWCVNAAVTKKTGASTVSQVGKGLKFNGTGAGATWPVSNQEQNQQYHFANYGFTLVATVRIDGDATGKKNSVLGIGLKENSATEKSIGLWCSDGKWGVGDGKDNSETISTTENCVNVKTYQVALTFKSKTVSLYINGKKIDELSEKSINVENEKITHFYFGANNGEQNTQPSAAVSHVTVQNVLLYNRQFGDDEIGKLKPKQIKPQESIKTPKEDIKADQRDDNTAGGNGDQQTPPTLPASPTEEEKAPSPSRTEDGGVGGGVCVFSLLLAVLCVSAPLLHL